MRPRRGLAPTHPSRGALTLVLAALLAACGSSASPSPTGSAPSSGQAEPSAGIGQVIPAPGSDSRIYAPNPGAIVVAIDPGHGGCLDWGVPNPYDNTVERSEKALTLDISLALRDRLEAEGATVVMTRDTDVALAGDDYPELGCTGDPFRDVNGDGVVGFGPDVPPETRTRDELAAHIDLVNLSRPDVLLSIHINSFTENGVVVEIAGTETYWTDETSWGVPFSQRLATEVQAEVVAALDELAPYAREDRGIDAVNYYVIAPPTTTDDPAQPKRGSLMPGVLAEVGSMSLEAEADLLATVDAQEAIAEALTDALIDWFAARELAGRIDLLGAGGQAGTPPPALPGEGPMYWAPVVEDPANIIVRLTNTGSTTWPTGGQLLAGWEETDEPYLPRPPELSPLSTFVPALGPGESVDVEVAMPVPSGAGREVAWVTLRLGGVVLAENGNPALQFEAGNGSS